MRALNYLLGKMKEDDIRQMVNNENYVRDRSELDGWLKKCDEIFAASMKKTDEELDNSLDKDLS